MVLSMILSALVIFLLRLIDMTMTTLRMVLVIRGLKLWSGILGFFQSLVFILTLAGVLQNLDNILNILGYAAGFSAGIMLGMALEERLALGYGHVRIISPTRGKQVAQALRTAGYAVTEMFGRGREGRVSVINCTVYRRKVPEVRDLATIADPECFITVDEIRPLRRGFWRN